MALLQALAVGADLSLYKLMMTLGRRAVSEDATSIQTPISVFSLIHFVHLKAIV